MAGTPLVSSLVVIAVLFLFFLSLDELHISGNWSRSPQLVLSSPQVMPAAPTGPGYSCDHDLA